MLRVVVVFALQTKLFMVEHFDLHLTVTLFERLFNILPNTIAALLFDHHTVNDHFDRMLFGFTQLYLIIQSHHHPVDHRTHVSFVTQ